jgi:hypothetical protein
MKDPDPDVRLGAVRLLDLWQEFEPDAIDRPAISRWRERVGDPDPRVRDYVFEHTTDTDVLIAWLRHPEPGVRRLACQRLQKSDVPDRDRLALFRSCRELLGSSDRDVREAAARIIEEWLQREPAAVDADTRNAWDGLALDPDPKIRLRVVARTERPDVLIRCLDSRDRLIAVAAANRLRVMPMPKERVPDLLRLCRDRRVWPNRFDDLGPVPDGVTGAFLRVGADAIAPLLSVLTDPAEEKGMKEMAVYLLRRLSGHASELARRVTPVLEHPDPEVRRMAEDLMARVRRPN